MAQVHLITEQNRLVQQIPLNERLISEATDLSFSPSLKPIGGQSPTPQMQQLSPLLADPSSPTPFKRMQTSENPPKPKASPTIIKIKRQQNPSFARINPMQPSFDDTLTASFGQTSTQRRIPVQLSKGAPQQQNKN